MTFEMNEKQNHHMDIPNVVLRFVQYLASTVLGLFTSSAPAVTTVEKQPVQPKNDNERIFGEKIEIIMAREKENGNVPNFVLNCCEILVAHADEEGIFRVPGSAKNIKEIASQVDNGNLVDLSEYGTCTIASLLKKYFRELPEPLLTNENHNAWMEIGSITNDDERSQRVVQLFSQLPNHHKNLFITLFSLLCMISSEPHLKTSRMTSDNLSYIFGLNIMKQDCFDTGGMSKVAKICILEFNNIKAYYDQQN
jgi:hypothetical protein